VKNSRLLSKVSIVVYFSAAPLKECFSPIMEVSLAVLFRYYEIRLQFDPKLILLSILPTVAAAPLSAFDIAPAPCNNRKSKIPNWVYFFTQRNCLLANHPIQLFHIRNHSTDQPFKLLPKILKILNSFPNLPPKHRHETPVSHAVLQSTPPLQFRLRPKRVS
jgi:hypothetical protein